MAMKNKNIKLSSYIRKEKKILILVTISGLLYNIGLVCGPYLEGLLVQCLYDVLNKIKTSSDLIQLSLVYVAIMAFVQIMRAIKRYSVRIFANDINWSMRTSLYHGLLVGDSHQQAGQWMTKAIADVDVCSEGIRKFITEIFDTGVVWIGYFVLLIGLDWKLTLLALIFMPIAYGLAAKLKMVVAQSNQAYKESEANLNDGLMDRVSRALLYRIFGQETNRNKALNDALIDYEKKSRLANIWEGSIEPIYGAIVMIGVVFILLYGSQNVVNQTWNLANFTTYLACFTKLATKTSHGAKLFNAVQKAQLSWARIQPWMKEDAFLYRPACSQVDSLTIQDLSFGPIHHMNAKMYPGQWIAITGKVASGKSLFLKTLIGQIDYTGSIQYGDKRQSCISYMGHEPELLSASIAENIALGDDVDVLYWMHFVGLDTEGLQPETYIGASGAQVSGGQQARIALARTLAHAKPIVVLDDPFAACDKKTEMKIIQNIRSWQTNQILLIVTHRLDWIDQCDQVLTFQEGQVMVHARK